MLIIIGRKIPTLVKLPENGLISKSAVREKIGIFFQALKYSSWRSLFFSWLEKNLRRLRVSVLKIDNLFSGLIGRARDKSQTWSVRSRAWMEHRRIKKKENLQVLEELDKAEILGELDKAKKAVIKDEEKALKEKIGIVGNGFKNGAKKEKATEETVVVGEKEKKCVEAIAKNPKDIESYRELGFFYLRQKNFPDARSCFRQVLKLSPAEAEIKKKLEEIEGLSGPNGFGEKAAEI